MNALDFFLPRLCFGCGEFTHNGAVICDWCRPDARQILSPKCPRCAQPQVGTGGVDAICSTCLAEARWFDGVHAAFEYDGPVSQAILNAKLGRDPRKLAALSEWGAEILAPVIEDRPFVPVPMWRADLVYRGFSSVRIFSDRLTKVGLGRRIDAIRKIEASRGLVELKKDRAERKRIASQVFERREEVCLPEEVVVVDDVLTTGATMTAIARLLKRAGVKRVTGIVLARDA